MPSLTEEQKQKLIDFINKIEFLQLQQVSASIQTYLLNQLHSILLNSKLTLDDLKSNFVIWFDYYSPNSLGVFLNAVGVDCSQISSRCNKTEYVYSSVDITIKYILS